MFKLRSLIQVTFKISLCLSLTIYNLTEAAATTIQQGATNPKRVILFVWDGLRPDAVTPQNTPNLYRLMKHGVQFVDHHSSYPTFTMMNASTFATGDFAGKTGFFGNILWHPGVHGLDATGKNFDFEQPVFTEDYKLLQDLNEDKLLLVKTLMQAAHRNGLSTAVIGKSGPAFLQDYQSKGIILDEVHVYPLSFAQQLQHDGYALPKLSPLAFNTNSLKLKSDNGNPTAAKKNHFMQDGVTPDTTNQSGSPYSSANQYMMNIYLNEVLPKIKPRLSVVWMRNPDTTEHVYGPGTPNYYAALKSNDLMLGQLEQQLKNLNLAQSTNIIIVSDHAHSHVSGPFSEFPLRSIVHGQIGKMDAQGESVSGEVRTADLLNKAGFHAYDGDGCWYDPILSGIKANGKTLYSTHIDKDGTICNQGRGKQYISPAYLVPAKNKLPKDAVIIAANGGSDYFYVPSHNKPLIQKLITFAQSHEQYGAIFVDQRYGLINGTMPMATVKVENPLRSPDLIVSFNYDEHAKINNLPGIEFSDYPNERGMHGSFSPIDVHNSLFAIGPDFRKQFQDNLPTANVDVAPTIAHLLGLKLPNTDGRVLFESLRGGSTQDFDVKKLLIISKSARNLNMVNTLNQPVQSHVYTINLHTKILTRDGQSYTYFDFAKALRD